MQRPPRQQRTTYSFAASPRAVGSPSRGAYRDEGDPRRDRRVRRRKAGTTSGYAGARETTPPPVAGRAHMSLQTEKYLEEIVDRPIEKEISTQTEGEFEDRPPTPEFVPPPRGIDTATQVLPGELFDFDSEVEPLLEMLVGRVLEQSVMEVVEEAELQSLREHQQEYERMRQLELAEVQRLQEAERRREEEKERRLKQERERLSREQRAAEKKKAKDVASSYLTDLVSTVFTNLNDKGYFYDAVEREVEMQFLPALLQGVEEHRTRMALADKMVEQLALHCLTEANAAHCIQKEKEAAAEEERLRALAEAEAERAALEVAEREAGEEEYADKEDDEEAYSDAEEEDEEDEEDEDGEEEDESESDGEGEE